MVLVWIALVLGLAGVALGATALLANHDALAAARFILRVASRIVGSALSGKGSRRTIRMATSSKCVTRRSRATRTAEYVRTCTPVLDDDIECNGAFQLSGGTIEIEATIRARPPRPLRSPAAQVHTQVRLGLSM
jgi:hypothetical protein